MKAADEQQYVEYVTARLPWMRRVAFLLCNDWHQTDDICQTALASLYIHWRKANDATNVNAYVRMIIVRAFLGERRKPWFRRVDLVDVHNEAIGVVVGRVQPADPDETETALVVRTALAALPPRQRAVVVLRYYCDLSINEVAATLQCSVGTVKSQTSKGVNSLRQLLAPQHVSVEG